MSQRRRRLARWCRYAVLVLPAVVFFIAAPLSAEAATCPPPASAKKGDGPDLQCRVQAVLDKHQTLLTTVKNKRGTCTDTPKNCQLVEERFEKAQNAHLKAVRAHGRLTGDDYADLHRKRKGKGPPAGSTTSFQALSAMPVAAAPADDVDPQIGEDLADQLDDMASALDSANEVVQDQGPVVTPPVHPTLYNYTDDPNYPRWLHVGPSSTFAQFAVLTSFQIAKAFKDALDPACQQTIVAAGFGGNTATACLVTAIIASALELTWELMEFRSGDTDTWEMHGAYVRAGQVFDNLSSLNSTVGSVTEAVGDLGPQLAQHDTDIKALLGELQTAVDNNTQQLKVLYAFQRAIVKLLLTQDGQKAVGDLLLTCTGDNCPLVVIECPGGQCKFPQK